MGFWAKTWENLDFPIKDCQTSSGDLHVEVRHDNVDTDV